MQEQRRVQLKYKIAISVAVVLALALAILLRSGAVPLPGEAPVRKNINGVVVDALTGRVIDGAEVILSVTYHDNPMPDGPGHDYNWRNTTTNEKGVFSVSLPARRKGWFGTDVSLKVECQGYHDSYVIVDPHNVPLPPGQHVPGTATVVTTLPPILTIKMVKHTVGMSGELLNGGKKLSGQAGEGSVERDGTSEPIPDE